MKTKKNEVALLDLENFSIAQLPELQSKKEEINAVIESNPVIVVIDNETYESAKKSRTAVKTLRTGLENEQKDVKRRIKKHILDVIDDEYVSLVSEVRIQEGLRQDEVTAYELKKEAEKQEKARLEQVRVDSIKKIIDDYVSEWKTAFNIMSFDSITEVGESFVESCAKFDLKVLAEFESLFPSKIEELTQYLSEKTDSLTDAENARLDRERVAAEAKKLAEERAELEAKQKAQNEADAKAKKEREDFEKEKADFEEKQRKEKEKSAFQIKVDNRISQLTVLDLKFDFQSTFVGFDFFIDVLDIKTYDDEKWDKLITQIKKKIATPIVETPQPDKVEETEVLAPEVPTVNVCYDLPKEPTWESIEEEFKNSGKKSYSKWLKENYNVPTKLQA